MTAMDPFECNADSANEAGFVPADCGTAKLSNEGENHNTGDSSGSYDIPRPFLTMQQAAAFLGKSVRALERSLMGRWGNKLPEGWTARKVKTEKGEEWRIIPPPGFRVRSHVAEPKEDWLAGEISQASDFLQEFSPAVRRGREHNIEQPTIVIDRSEEVEHLLRELLSCQKSLAEERRMHMDDIRMVAQLQGSMRLLETSASENVRAKQELWETKQELEKLKQEYNQVLNLPWWKRIFGLK